MKFEARCSAIYLSYMGIVRPWLDTSDDVKGYKYVNNYSVRRSLMHPEYRIVTGLPTAIGS